MSAYEVAPAAHLDLLELWNRIAEDDLDRADRIVTEIEQTFALIASHPRMGHPRPTLLPPRFLFHPVYSWEIIYNPDAHPLRILRVWHGAQEKPEIPET
jgi:plasmid stabilization system protein ParE